MKPLRTSRRVRASQRVIFLGGCGLIVTASVALTAPNAAIVADGGQHSIVPGGLYTGSRSCDDGNCHSGKAEEQSGQLIGDEYTIWDKRDPHRKGYETLSNDASKAIAAEMGLGDPTAEASCQKCHAPHVPADQFKEGDDWPISEGVGCEVCHGPADQWIKPHEEAGWTSGVRAAKGTTGLFGEFKLIDTSDLRRRAALCVSCHLSIDSSMVAAGHPPLEFEMGAYNNYMWKQEKKKPLIHWEPPGDEPMLDAKLWGIGQQVALDAARKQVTAWSAAGADSSKAEGLVALFEGGVGIAERGLGIKNNDAVPVSVTINAGQSAAAARELAGLAEIAQSAVEYSIILNGVLSLTGASEGGPRNVRGIGKPMVAARKLITEIEEGKATVDEHRAELGKHFAEIAGLAKSSG